MLNKYIGKIKGGQIAPPRVNSREILFSWLGSAIAMGIIVAIQYSFFDTAPTALIFAPFGASAVLVFGASNSPLSQPRNLVGGHVISALVGVSVYKLFGGDSLLAVSLAVSTAIAIMHLTKTLHAPGGATAMLAVMGGPEIYKLGYSYLFMPCGIGALTMLLVALVFNNLAPGRKYPLYWF